MKFSLGRSVSPLNQEIIIKLLSASSYDRHLRLFRHHLELQAIQLVKQFSTFFPENSSTSTPKGGYSIWTELPSETDMQFFYKTCEKLGINFTPGTTFSFTNTYDHCFRTIFSQPVTSESLDAIKKIGASIIS